MASKVFKGAKEMLALMKGDRRGAIVHGRRGGSKSRKAKQAVREIRQFLAGKRDGVRVTTYEFPNAKAIREKLGLTHHAFAERFQIPVGTLRD